MNPPAPARLTPAQRSDGDDMAKERIVRMVAGTMVLASLALGVERSPAYVSGWFLWLTAFVGANLLQSAFTGFCPLDLLLARMERGGRPTS